MHTASKYIRSTKPRGDGAEHDCGCEFTGTSVKNRAVSKAPIPQTQEVEMKRIFSLFGMLALAAASCLVTTMPAAALNSGKAPHGFQNRHFDFIGGVVARPAPDHFGGLDRLHLASYREPGAGNTGSGASQRIDLVNLPAHLASTRLHDPAAASPSFFRRE